MADNSVIMTSAVFSVQQTRTGFLVCFGGPHTWDEAFPDDSQPELLMKNMLCPFFGTPSNNGTGQMPTHNTDNWSGPGMMPAPTSGTGPGPSTMPSSSAGSGPGPSTMPSSSAGSGPGQSTMPSSSAGSGPCPGTAPAPTYRDTGVGPGPPTYRDSGSDPIPPRLGKDQKTQTRFRNRRLHLLLVWPNIKHEMLGMIMGRGGTDELGATLWGQTELSCFDDSQHGIWGMSY
eukprot:3303171-Rhodomonas_salina.3